MREQQIRRNADAVRVIVALELETNIAASDVHSEEDMATDVVERLIRVYSLPGFNREAVAS